MKCPECGEDNTNENILRCYCGYRFDPKISSVMDDTNRASVNYGLDNGGIKFSSNSFGSDTLFFGVIGIGLSIWAINSYMEDNIFHLTTIVISLFAILSICVFFKSIYLHFRETNGYDMAMYITPYEISYVDVSIISLKRIRINREAITSIRLRQRTPGGQDLTLYFSNGGDVQIPSEYSHSLPSIYNYLKSHI